jgi:hypothetical protein
VLNGVFGKIGAEWDNFQAHVAEYIDAGDRVITLGYDSGHIQSDRAQYGSTYRLYLDSAGWLG